MADLTQQLAAELSTLSQVLIAREWFLSVAESCTGGMLGAEITALSGSSVWFDCGFVTYSNESKIHLLHVNENIIDSHGAVSEAVAIEMAQGALANSQSQLAVAITGIAGPTGGSPDKPIGTVCFAWTSETTATISETHLLRGDRKAVRQQSVLIALEGLNRLINRATN